MTIRRDSTLREAAFEVCTALDAVGVIAVLTGGGAASFYAPEAIQSFDLDFILTRHDEADNPGRVLEDIGFHLEGQDYRHEVSPFQLEFPPGPLAIGGELIERWDTIKEGHLLLHVLTPTDSCRDRLAAFYHFRDRSALQQALAICSATPKRIDFNAIRGWSKREGMSPECDEFLGLATG